ncbi:gamma-butyrobetaine hydroxylase-like domain-containing protein [Thalassotalea sp. PLHSN55]|uniref:gamma-butyrobetaine hydroxylase-like domain-containing protein n=1 Tax=Thalassotalea sp. PLHSN55 TaxID=3435888 RepID=UPI003F860290
MSQISCFTLKKDEKLLLVELDQQSVITLPFEYLRVFSPLVQSHQGNNIVSHKKMVQIRKIESVGKHGYRFLFDDDHSAIYGTTYLIQLFHEYDIRWKGYLANIANSAHNREANIDIKQL